MGGDIAAGRGDRCARDVSHGKALALGPKLSSERVARTGWERVPRVGVRGAGRSSSCCVDLDVVDRAPSSGACLDRTPTSLRGLARLSDMLPREQAPCDAAAVPSSATGMRRRSAEPSQQPDGSGARRARAVGMATGGVTEARECFSAVPLARHTACDFAAPTKARRPAASSIFAPILSGLLA